MKLGIFAKVFEGTDPFIVLSAVAAAGFSAAQYNMICSGLPALPNAIPNQIALDVAAAAQSAGVEIVSLSGTYNMIHPDPAVRVLGHQRLEALASSAAAMSARLITLCTGTRDPVNQWRRHPANDAPEAWRDLLVSMETAVHVAERHNVDLGVEPELANVVNSAEKARRLIDEIGSRRLKIVLDPANLFEVATIERQRDAVSAAVDLLADRIVMGHAKDRTPAGSFTTAGKGVLDYPHYLACLGAAGFRGPLVAHGLSPEEAAGVAAFLRHELYAAGIAVSP